MTIHSLSCGAILAAGGIGSRMAAGQPKQLLRLNGVPILARSVAALLSLTDIAEMVVVAPASHLAACKDSCNQFLEAAQLSRVRFTAGGETRQDSVRNGLAALSPAPELILVHDAARPLADADLIRRVLDAASTHGAAIAAIPVTDTIKEVARDSGEILSTIDRTKLFQAQTPQIIRRGLLQAAYQKADTDGFVATDEASLLEHAGIPVRAVMGSPRNLKITRPDDLLVASAFLTGTNKKTGEAAMRIGHGMDAHRLVPERKLILGGVDIPHTLGLLGHSDADVLCHALMDAILGALGLGDIGRHFPDSDSAYAGADSVKLLSYVAKLMQERGFRLGNADMTIICQAPRLMPHIPAMRANLARACGVQENCLNVKATTTEKMGYAGRGEGIAAHAVVLLEGAGKCNED